MNITTKWVVIGFVFGAVIFLLSPAFPQLITNHDFWSAKERLLYLTGSIAMSYMVISMVISIRLGRINSIMGGLDKGYIVHKWTGILALVFSILHYLMEQGPKWLVGLGLLVRPEKIKGIAPYSDFAKNLYKTGNTMVEYAFYVMVAVVLVALLKKIPYNIFRLVHKTIPVLFLIIAYHSATIQIKGQWFGSVGSFLLNAILIAGTIAAVIALFQGIGKRNKIKTSVKEIIYDKNTGIIELILKVVGHKFVYKAGQYVFLTFAHSREPHPFSIASYNGNGDEICFLIKKLGDFTDKLPENIEKGQTVIMEGPYGAFNFEDGNEYQIWIACGIGVTPFISRLEYMGRERNKNQRIDFFYSERGDGRLKPKLEKLCEKAGVNFHYCDTSKDGRLDLHKIKGETSYFDKASFWYCGPGGFGKYIKKAMKDMGMKTSLLHFDSFDMR